MAVRKRTWATKSGERRTAWIIDYADQAGDRHIRTFDRKKDADKFHAKVSVDVDAGIHTAPSKSITVAEAAEDWIRSAELEGREATTVAQYRQHAQHIVGRIGNVKLANLTTPGLNKFRDDLLGTVSRAMARKVMSSLKSLLRDAQRRGNVAQNAALAGLHSLRHFFASWLINPPERGGQGLAAKVVKQRLGHRSILMTMDTYGHLFPPEKDAHEKLANAERALLGDAT